MIYYRCRCRRSLTFDPPASCIACPDCGSGFATSPEYEFHYTPGPHKFDNNGLCSLCKRTASEIRTHPRPPKVLAQ